MKAQAVIRLNFSSEKQLKVVLEALKPETRTAPTRRSKVQVKGEGNNLTLSFEATDTSAMRAAINSYLRQTSMLIDVLRLIEVSCARRARGERTGYPRRKPYWKPLINSKRQNVLGEKA